MTAYERKYSGSLHFAVILSVPISKCLYFLNMFFIFLAIHVIVIVNDFIKTHWYIFNIFSIFNVLLLWINFVQFNPFYIDCVGFHKIKIYEEREGHRVRKEERRERPLWCNRYSPEQLFSVVAAVDLYQDFVPWCQKSTILWQKETALDAELEIGFKFLVERYVSHVELKRPTLIKVLWWGLKIFFWGIIKTILFENSFFILIRKSILFRHRYQKAIFLSTWRILGNLNQAQYLVHAISIFQSASNSVLHCIDR